MLKKLSVVLLGLAVVAGCSTGDGGSSGNKNFGTSKPNLKDDSLVEEKEYDSVNFMLVGDTLTHGFDGDYTWRYRLDRLLEKNMYDFAFAGNKGEPADPVDSIDGSAGVRNQMLGSSAPSWYADSDFHKSYVGDSDWGYVNGPSIKQLVANEKPDVVVFMLGLNDVENMDDRDMVKEAVVDDIEEVREAKPGVNVVLAEVPNTWVDGVEELNEVLREVTGEYPDGFVVVADTSDGYTVNDTWDDVHPASSGEVKIAQATYDALVELELVPPVKHDKELPDNVYTYEVSSIKVEKYDDVETKVTWVRPLGSTSYELTYTSSAGVSETVGVPVGEEVGFTEEYYLKNLISGETYEFTVTPLKGKLIGENANTASYTAE